MRIGVVGLGRIGAFHARVLRGLPGVNSLVLADLDLHVAEHLARELEATACSSIDQVIEAAVDALVITASTTSHAELVQTAIKARLPVFCEKQLTLDLETTDRIVELVRSSGVQIQVGFQRRFDPGYARARELVQAGSLGQLYMVRAAGHDPAPPPESFLAASGGMYRDLHIHDFDIIPWVTGQAIVRIYAEGEVLVDERCRNYDDVDTTAAVFGMSGGTLGILSGSRNDPLGYDIRMELFGSLDSVVVGWDDKTPMRSVEPNFKQLSGPHYLEFRERFDRAYRAELTEFLRVARGEVESPCTVEEARESLRVALAAERSRREHRPVPVQEI